MGIIDGSPDSRINKGYSWVKYVLIGGLLLLFVFILLYMYRSVGYIGANRSYRCVEDDISLVDGVNNLYDLDEGVIYDDPDELATEASEALVFIEERGECLEGYVKAAMSELSERQVDVDVKAVAYLQLVRDISDSSEAEVMMSERVSELDTAYEQFRTEVAEYEGELVNVEGRFFLVAL